MQEKLISVIIPSYNRKETLPGCIESVLKQSYNNIEIVIADDGSTDGTQELFENYPDARVRYVRYEPNRGACHARNYGAALSRGEYIAFQDSDDFWHTDKLEKQLALLEETGADMCYCGMNRVAENGNRFYYPVTTPRPDCQTEDFLAENRAGTQTMLMRRRVWEELRFDEGLRRYQDWDFALRVASRFRMCYLPEALVESAVGADSISAVVNSYPHLLHLYQKHEPLYKSCKESDAVMHRRLGKRIRPVDPAKAAYHFAKSFALSANLYSFSYCVVDAARALLDITRIKKK